MIPESSVPSLSGSAWPHSSSQGPSLRVPSTVTHYTSSDLPPSDVLRDVDAFLQSRLDSQLRGGQGFGRLNANYIARAIHGARDCELVVIRGSNGEINGVAVVKVKSSPRNGDYVYIDAALARRGAGAGRQLVQAARDMAEEWGVDSVHLEAIDPAAWGRLGFTVAGPAVNNLTPMILNLGQAGQQITAGLTTPQVLTRVSTGPPISLDSLPGFSNFV